VGYQTKADASRRKMVATGVWRPCGRETGMARNEEADEGRGDIVSTDQARRTIQRMRGRGELCGRTRRVSDGE